MLQGSGSRSEAACSDAGFSQSMPLSSFLFVSFVPFVVNPFAASRPQKKLRAICAVPNPLNLNDLQQAKKVLTPGNGRFERS